MKKKRIFHLIKPFLLSVAEDSNKKKTYMVIKKKVYFIDIKTSTNEEYECEGQCQGHKWNIFKKRRKNSNLVIIRNNFL